MTTVEERAFLEAMALKHLPDRHDQSTHGRRGPRSLTPESAASMQKRMLKGNPWSDSSKEAFEDWTGNGYADINDILRRPDAYGPIKTEFLSGQIRGIRDGLRPLPQPVRVFRAVDMSRMELPTDESLVGRRFQNAGFTATTVGERDDIPDVDPSETEYDAILEIDVPKGVGAAYLESLTANEGEHELLLDAGLVLEFTGIDRQGDWPIVKARVVTP